MANSRQSPQNVEMSLLQKNASTNFLTLLEFMKVSPSEFLSIEDKRCRAKA